MEYTFYKNEKGTIWYQEAYLVEAETEEIARLLFIEACKNEEQHDIYEISLDYFEPIVESFSPISIKDNNGESTVEIMDENANIIWKNNEIN